MTTPLPKSDMDIDSDPPPSQRRSNRSKPGMDYAAMNIGKTKTLQHTDDDQKKTSKTHKEKKDDKTKKINEQREIIHNLTTTIDIKNNIIADMERDILHKDC